jgi:hypothetical protein
MFLEDACEIFPGSSEAASIDIFVGVMSCTSPAIRKRCKAVIMEFMQHLGDIEFESEEERLTFLEDMMKMRKRE